MTNPEMTADAIRAALAIHPGVHDRTDCVPRLRPPPDIQVRDLEERGAAYVQRAATAQLPACARAVRPCLRAEEYGPTLRAVEEP